MKPYNKCKRFTVRMHVARLEKMLELDSPCESCPWGTDLRFTQSLFNQHQAGKNLPTGPCKTCRDFLDIPESAPGCPCFVFTDPIEITLNKLSEYYEQNP